MTRLGHIKVAVEPEAVLMDEPCSARDPIATARLEELVRELKSRFAIVIFANTADERTESCITGRFG